MFKEFINYISDFFVQLFRTIIKLINNCEVKRKWFVNVISNSTVYSRGDNYFIKKNIDIFKCFPMEITIYCNNEIAKKDLDTLIDNALLGCYDKIIKKIYKKNLKKILKIYKKNI